MEGEKEKKERNTVGIAMNTPLPFQNKLQRRSSTILDLQNVLKSTTSISVKPNRRRTETRPSSHDKLRCAGYVSSQATRRKRKILRDPQCCLKSTASTSDYKPGRRWAEYQGINNWSGFLDPLDTTLRSEILRYGQFVQAAYTSFDSDPTSPAYATCRHRRSSLLPDSARHTVTRNLHASSGARLPAWADRVGPAWMTRRSSWIGYVAVCDDEEEIARLGRRDIVIAFRGTATCMEWLENLRATLTHLPYNNGNDEPMVESGFWSLFTSCGLTYTSLRDQIREEIQQLLDTYGGSSEKPISITITGHSLGAALAVLTAYDITATFKNSPLVTVFSFGGPRIGNTSFRRRLEKQGSKVLRIVNTHDIITKVPGFVVDREIENDNHDINLPSWLLSKTGWVYADIGQELRVSSQRTANVAACHDLDVYLNLVNQLSSTCPFRAKVKGSFPWPFGTQLTAICR